MKNNHNFKNFKKQYSTLPENEKKLTKNIIKSCKVFDKVMDYLDETIN